MNSKQIYKDDNFSFVAEYCKTNKINNPIPSFIKWVSAFDRNDFLKLTDTQLNLYFDIWEYFIKQSKNINEKSFKDILNRIDTDFNITADKLTTLFKSTLITHRTKIIALINEYLTIQINKSVCDYNLKILLKNNFNFNNYLVLKQWTLKYSTQLDKLTENQLKMVLFCLMFFIKGTKDITINYIEQFFNLYFLILKNYLEKLDITKIPPKTNNLNKWLETLKNIEKYSYNNHRKHFYKSADVYELDEIKDTVLDDISPNDNKELFVNNKYFDNNLKVLNYYLNNPNFETFKDLLNKLEQKFLIFDFDKIDELTDRKKQLFNLFDSYLVKFDLSLNQDNIKAFFWLIQQEKTFIKTDWFDSLMEFEFNEFKNKYKK